MSFNQREYINNYKKEHYAKLSVDLRKEDKEKLAKICKEQGITIKQFILQAINKQVEELEKYKQTLNKIKNIMKEPRVSGSVLLTLDQIDKLLENKGEE